MQDNRKVLCLFDYKCHTGWASTSTNIIQQLKNHYGKKIQFDIIAINYFGEPIIETDGTFIISAVKSATKIDKHGRMGFLKILKESNDYDAIFIMEDLGVITPMIPVIKFIRDEKIKNNKKLFKSIFYTCVDCNITNDFTSDLDFFTSVFAYTEYTSKQLLNLNPKLLNSLQIINSGININEFYVLDNNENLKFRKEYFAENADKIIFSNINRNQSRKDMPTTIFSFVKAREIWETKGYDRKLFLYLHCDPKDPMGWDLRLLLKQTNLVENEDYKLLSEDFCKNGTTTEMLNKIYNATDVYITTTLGEGWGLTFVEAAVTKTPIIAPYSSSFMEMSKNSERAYMLKKFNPTANVSDSMIRLQCNQDEVVDKILYVAEGLIGKLDSTNNFTKLHKDMIEKAYIWATNLSWDIVGKSWIKSFGEILNIEV